MRAPARGSVLAAAAAVLLLLPVGARAAAAPKITTVAPLGAAWPGGHVKVVSVVGGHGRRVRGRLVYFLSRNRRHDRKDVRIGRGKVKRAPSRVAASISIPRRTKPGRWYLLACAGARCKATRLPVVPKPSPRHVTVQTDASHTVTQRVSAAAGGTVTATGPDGSQYTLTLPANALMFDTNITLTPVTGLSGLKGHGTPAAGVQLGPDGLVLLKPATLTIAPARAVPVSRQISYAWHGSGQESGLYPPNPKAAGFTLSLSHFSGYEVIDGSKKDRAALVNQPTNVQDRWAAAEAAAEAARAAGGTGPASERWAKAMEQALQTQYDSVVKPQLDAAVGDDTLAYSAIQAGLSWAHEAALLGVLEREQSYVLGTLARILDNAIKQSAQKCNQGQIAFVQRILSLARARAILGTAEDRDDLAAINKCLHFDLDFTADSEMTAGWHYVAHTEVKNLPIVPAGIGPAQPASASVQFSNVSETTGATGCDWSYNGVTENHQFTVYALTIDASLREVIDSHGRAHFDTPPPNISLEMLPGSYLEQFTVDCHDDRGPEPAVVGIYISGWGLNFQNEVIPAGHYLLTGWSPGTNGALAQFSYDRTFQVPDCGGCSSKQAGTLVLRQAVQN